MNRAWLPAVIVVRPQIGWVLKWSSPASSATRYSARSPTRL